MFLTRGKVKEKTGIMTTGRTLKYHEEVSAKQFLHCLSFAIRSSIKRPFLNQIIGLRINAECMINGLMNLINDNGIYDGLAGPFICRLTKYIALLDSTTKHEHGTSIREMTVGSMPSLLIFTIQNR